MCIRDSDISAYVETDSIFELSHLFVSPPQMEHSPFGFRPPQEPDNGFLLKITPIDIAIIARDKIIIPSIISIMKS
mgnify:FL=1